MRYIQSYKDDRDNGVNVVGISLTAILFGVVVILLLMLSLLFSGCQRREMYVYGDEFHSVTMNVDWRELDDGSNPDGMTVWFWNLDDPTLNVYRTTSASVRSLDLYLPNGNYQGCVVSYSPEEYSRQRFVYMNQVDAARVESEPYNYQPDEVRTPGAFITDETDKHVKMTLFSDYAWNDHLVLRPEQKESGYYVVAAQPEPIGTDTIDNRLIYSGSRFGDYIPYEERDSYQQTIQVKYIDATPHTLVWTGRVRVFIKEGFDYLWQPRASITGLCDGHYLARHYNTDRSCLISLDSWEKVRTGDNQGWINCTFTCFGMRSDTRGPEAELHPSSATGKSLYDGEECDWSAYWSHICEAEDLQLNLAFILRDQATVVDRSFKVGLTAVSYDDQLVLRLVLDDDFFHTEEGIDGGGDIILPYVDPYDGAGFDGDVDPWIDEPPVDVPM